METTWFMGCDIGQDSFTFCLRSRAEICLQGEVVNTSQAIRKWLKDLKKLPGMKVSTILFCLEHTGVYGQILLRELFEQNLTVSVEAAATIKLSMGLQRGKNDKVDAQRIAEYAMRYMDRLKQWKPKREAVQKLQTLNAVRSRLIKARHLLLASLESTKRFVGKEHAALIDKNQKHTLKGLDLDIAATEKAIHDIIHSDENLHRLSQLVTSVQGIGMVTCAAMLVRTNEFQDYTEPKKFACSVGLAPFEHTSGSSVRGKTRVSHHAHKDLKTLLHMCALGCIGRPGELKDYYDRKVAEGKNKMLVINAVRNKLVGRVFAVVRKGIMYEKNYQYGLVMS